MPRRAVKFDFGHSTVSNSGVSVAPTATSIPVADGNQFPDTANGKFTIRFPTSGEVCRVNTRVGNVFTSVTRGLPEGALGTYSGTTILDNAEVDEIWGAQDIADSEDYIPPLDASNITTGTLAPARLPLATTGAFGAVKPDGSTITVSGGVISSSGGGGGGSGTVTSVGLSLPGDFIVSGSPVTGAGTLTAVRNVQSANVVSAGPATGSPASPTYRALVQADIPALDASQLTTGALAKARQNANTAYTDVATTFAVEVTVPDLKVSGLTGSTQTSRHVGATASGAPTTGPHLVGDASLSLADGKWYVCTVAGTPGTFVSAAGSGTVTSVGLSVPSALLNVSGSPITSSGTLAISLATQSANTVLAGPTSGSAATPTMRALVAADVSAIAPTLAPAPSGDTTGVTDNAALQAILTGFPSTGGILRLQPGTYYITGLTASKPTTIIGCGAADALYAGAVTTLICPSATANAITVGAQPFIASDFSLKNSSTPTAGSGILATSAHVADGMRLSNVSVRGFYVNLDATNGGEWYMAGCFSYDPVLHALRIANTTVPDGGDQIVQGCQFIAGPTNLAPAALVRYESGGGLKFIGNKLNARGSAAATIGFDLAVEDGVSTSVLEFVGNSVENFTTYGMRAHLKGTTGTFSKITIALNEFLSTSSGTCIAITPEATGKIGAVVLGPNVLTGASVGYALANVDNVVLNPSVYDAVTTHVSIGSGVTNLVQPSTNANATTGADGLVRVDNTSSGDPVALTLAGYLASITGLTHSNLAAAAGILLAQLGQSGATTGQVPTWNGSAYVPADVAGSGSDHLHGLARWAAAGGATFELPDLAEYLQMVYDNGTAVDETTVSLSADRTQLIFDTAPTAGHILQAQYVVGRI